MTWVIRIGVTPAPRRRRRNQTIRDPAPPMESTAKRIDWMRINDRFAGAKKKSHRRKQEYGESDLCGNDTVKAVKFPTTNSRREHPPRPAGRRAIRGV